ncbi:MAG: DoxX family membrane protein [Bacteroidetes bacterium]|jgi:thiosulfate dehydrogenase [quinone] large subunit|nr:DoxX family membrane protein [Bacteroidota bacterium]
MNYIYAFTLLRAVLGINLFMHGLVRIKKGDRIFIDSLLKEFAQSGLPVSLLTIFGAMLPYTELIIGLMLIAGLLTQSVLIAGCLLMFVLLIGKSLVADWGIVTFQMLYILIYCILLGGLKYNALSVDALIMVINKF